MNIPANRRVVTLPIVKLPKGPHAGKDQYKSDFSTKFIGQGCPGSSTYKYAILTQSEGVPMNCGTYRESDVVFISANGARPGALPPNTEEIQKAIQAGATFLTDGKCFRPEGGHHYNTGEQVVANILRKAGFVEREELNGKVARWHKEGTEPAFIIRQDILSRLTQRKEKTWQRSSDQGYEVSSRGGKELDGDNQFSALYAKLKDGRTIEEAYQLDIKGYRVHGSDWRIGKGKESLVKMTMQEQYERYKGLWAQWCDENPGKLEYLERRSQGKVLTDGFATSEINQARVLSELINERIYKIEKPAQPTLFTTSERAAKSESLTMTPEPIAKTLPPKANYCVIKRTDPFLPERVREESAVYVAIPFEELNRYNRTANKGAQRTPVITGTELECKVFAAGTDEVRELVRERIDVRINLFTPTSKTTPEQIAELKERYQQLSEQMKLKVPEIEIHSISKNAGKQITY